MKNFKRALAQAVRYWKSLAIATCCSFAVAALWGANIGAFYPILEVTMNGESMHDWIDEEIDKAEKQEAESRQALAEVEAKLAVPNAPDRVRLEQKLADAKSKVLTDSAKTASYKASEPWVKTYVPSDPFNTISLIVGALMISTLIKHFFLISNEYLVGRVSLDVSRSIRRQVFEKAIYMDRLVYGSYGTSSFTSRITHTTDMLSRGLMNTLGAALREPLKALACLALAAFICWRLLLLSIIVAPVVGVMLYFVTKRLRAISRSELERAEGYHKVMLESLGNIQTVQSYQMEEEENKRFADATMAMRNFGLNFIFYSSLTKPIIEFLGLGMLGTTIVGGAYIVLNQQTALFGIPICDEPLSVSALLVFFGALIGVSDPLRKMSAVYSYIYAGIIAANSLYTILDQSNEIKDPETPKTVPSPHRSLSLNELAFAYDAQPVLENVNVEIPFGSTIALIGQNGCGKSTMINLLSRFFDPKSGSIQLDGVDYRDMKVDDVRRRIALVNQQTELFSNSVTYNIRYGNAGTTDEEVVAAAQAAHAHEFITESLEDGYDTNVGQNGGRLSGGQRQRIALARALLRNPEILILDEATSQIDMKSEELICDSLAQHRGQRTMIIITHREKLLELADRVFEMKNGRLEEVEPKRYAA